MPPIRPRRLPQRLPLPSPRSRRWRRQRQRNHPRGPVRTPGQPPQPRQPPPFLPPMPARHQAWPAQGPALPGRQPLVPARRGQVNQMCPNLRKYRLPKLPALQPARPRPLLQRRLRQAPRLSTPRLAGKNRKQSRLKLTLPQTERPYLEMAAPAIHHPGRLPNQPELHRPYPGWQ